MKTLSLIIPAYNSQAFLDKCLSSMLVPQCLDKLEIIVVNDGSTDATETIAKQYCARYPETVRLISQENRGHGGALNTGCAAASGRYLKVIDADDWVASENLPAFLALLESCDSDVVLTHYHTIDISTAERKSWKTYPEAFGRPCSFEQIMPRWKQFDRCLTLHGIAYRTAFYQAQDVSLSEHVFYEDNEYAAYPCCLARSVTPLDLFVYEYRIGDVNQSVSDENQCRRLGHTDAVLRKLEQLYARLSPCAGRDYAAMKIRGVLISYLTTTLLMLPNRRQGRRLAREQMARCRAAVPQAARMARKQHLFFLAMNRLGLTHRTWKKMLDSNLYNRLRKNHSFS